MYAIKKILVPTDFSENASAAYHPAQQLAQKYGATVDFIHIIPSNNYYAGNISNLGVPLNSDVDIYSELEKETFTKLDELMNNFIKQENRGDCYVEVSAKPSKAIAEKAMSGGYDLIVMAAKGKHATDFWAGSTTKRTIRYAKIPVFSTEKSHIDGLQNILVPTDGTQESLRALSIAISLAMAFNAKITIYNVMVLRYPLLDKSTEKNLEPTYQEIQERVYSEMKTFFSNSGDKATLQKNEADETIIIYQKDDSSVEIDTKIVVQARVSKYDAIEGYAREEADIMIMATHGRRGVPHLVFGSVAEEVADALKLPVITVGNNRNKS